ncbi:MAG: hypothetical protein CMK09_17630 [Ponticaulis sp.]|nr:hypothetical protein [Ponticaulis sp.]|tara:strand:- start:20473 stop:21078 length:606 start_codon:yes stop_codon:yes gene_type:complete
MTELLALIFSWQLLLLSLIAQIIVGLLIADFASGFFHWLEDRYGGPDWPIVGGLVRATIRHHKKPRRMLNSAFWHRSGPTLLIAVCFGLVFLSLGWLNLMTITALAFGSMANEIHNWSHCKPSECGPVVTWLQKKRVFISPLDHARHHREKKNTYYCTVTGWMNPVLERIRFWRKVEAVIRIVARSRPRRDPTVRRRPVLV